MIPARSVPTLAITLAALALVGWLNLAANPRASLFTGPAPQGSDAGAR